MLGKFFLFSLIILGFYVLYNVLKNSEFLWLLLFLMVAAFLIPSFLGGRSVPIMHLTLIFLFILTAYIFYSQEPAPITDKIEILGFEIVRLGEDFWRFLQTFFALAAVIVAGYLGIVFYPPLASKTKARG